MTSAQAALVTYSNAAAWNTAVPNKATVTIPNLPNLPGFLFLNNSVTFSGVTFSTNPNDLGSFFQIGTGFPAFDPVLTPVLSLQMPGDGTLAGGV